MQNFPGAATPPAPHCIWDKPNFFANTSHATFSQSLLNEDFFFYFRYRPWYSDSDQWPTDQLILHLYSLFGQPVFCSIFILSKNKGFGLELYWKCLFHLFSWKNLVNNKNTLKNADFN